MRSFEQNPWNTERTCAPRGGFLSGENEPMRIHRHWIEPRPLVCCVPESGAAGLNLVSSAVPGQAIPAGETLPLILSAERWGDAPLWDEGSHSASILCGGLYSISWQMAAAALGTWPVLLALEDQNGRRLAACAGMGSMLTGACVCCLAGGTVLRFVNRSRGAVRLIELSSDTAVFGEAVQIVRLGR